MGVVTVFDLQTTFFRVLRISIATPAVSDHLAMVVSQGRGRGRGLARGGRCGGRTDSEGRPHCQHCGRIGDK